MQGNGRSGSTPSVLRESTVLTRQGRAGGAAPYPAYLLFFLHLLISFILKLSSIPLYFHSRYTSACPHGKKGWSIYAYMYPRTLPHCCKRACVFSTLITISNSYSYKSFIKTQPKLSKLRCITQTLGYWNTARRDFTGPEGLPGAHLDAVHWFCINVAVY